MMYTKRKRSKLKYKIGAKRPKNLVYINKILVCLSICLYPINAKTAEPIAQILCRTSHDPRERLWMMKTCNKIQFSSNFENPRFLK